VIQRDKGLDVIRDELIEEFVVKYHTLKLRMRVRVPYERGVALPLRF
jgi:hypothetical protein